MPTSFEHRSTYAVPAAELFATLVDEAFLTARLREVGGKDATLVEYSRAGEEVALRMRQGVEAAQLPGAVRSILGGDLVVDREERWRASGDGHEGTSRVSLSGVPGEIRSRSRVAADSGGSALVITAQVRVNIPLVGGKLEKVVADQVGKLLATEAEFAEKWLAEQT